MSCGCQSCALLIKEAFVRRVRATEGARVDDHVRSFCRAIRQSGLKDHLVLTVLLDQLRAELAAHVAAVDVTPVSSGPSVHEAIDQFERQTLAAIGVGPTQQSLSPLIRRVLNLLGEQSAPPPSSSPTTIASLASALGCSAPALARRFQQETGESLRARLFLTRMHRAYALILQGEKVDVVALGAGYRSKSAFLRAFRRVAGITPSELRLRCHAPASSPKA